MATMSLDKSIRQVVQAAIDGGHESRYSIAKVAGIDYRALSRWLDEDRDIRLSTASKLADYFGLRIVKGNGATRKRR